MWFAFGHAIAVNYSVHIPGSSAPVYFLNRPMVIKKLARSSFPHGFSKRVQVSSHRVLQSARTRATAGGTLYFFGQISLGARGRMRGVESSQAGEKG